MLEGVGVWEVEAYYRDGYEVQCCERKGGRSEVLWHAGVLCGLEDGCEVCLSMLQVAVSTKTYKETDK